VTEALHNKQIHRIANVRSNFQLCITGPRSVMLVVTRLKNMSAIETLAKISKHSAARLNPPAQKGDVAELSSNFTIPLPVDFVEAFTFFDGEHEDSAAMDFRLLSLEEILSVTAERNEENQELAGLFDDEPAAKFEDGGWSDSVVVIGSSTADWELVLNLVDGAVYQFQMGNPPCKTAASYREYLNNQLAKLNDAG